MMKYSRKIYSLAWASSRRKTGKVRPGGVVGGLRVAVGGAQGGVLQVPGLLHGVRPVVEEVGGGKLGHQVVLHGPAGLCPAVVGLAAAP